MTSQDLRRLLPLWLVLAAVIAAGNILSAQLADRWTTAPIFITFAVFAVAFSAIGFVACRERNNEGGRRALRIVLVVLTIGIAELLGLGIYLLHKLA